MALVSLPASVALPAASLDSLVATNSNPTFVVRAYEVLGRPRLPPEILTSLFSKYTGTNVSLTDIVKAAAEVQREYQNRGGSNVCVAVAERQITNGVVALTVFNGRVPQILVSGRRYPLPEGAAATAAAKAPPASSETPAQTKPSPRFSVRSYAIAGNSQLSIETLTSIFSKYTGTNIGVSEIIKAASELQMEYRDRGYPTVSVTVPPQQITNEIVQIRVFEGLLSGITVSGNRFFSSNNVMRALPSLQTNTILNGPVFQAELDRANANQDRQIYPQIEPGLETNTTLLDLKVKDRLPLHAKLELNNQNSPGTPDLRLNSSTVFNNLWQFEHSVGIQYSFSPEAYKAGDEWNFYDRPLVANYSAFYRLPLGSPESLADTLATTGAFGYNEATRKFTLPAASGQPELNFYGSRSTIDTSLLTTFNQILYSTNGNSLERKDVQNDLTINQNLGTRFSVPFAVEGNFRSSLSGGLDYKTYDLESHKTNIFTLTSVVIDDTSNPGHPVTNINVSVVNSPVPSNGVTHTHMDYLPLALRYDGSARDALGFTTFGVGLSLNAWYSGGLSNLHKATSSSRGSGGWFIVNPSLSRDFIVHTNWTLTLRADGQWASEPLPSNEQFGAGGVASVRGYHEGEVFGDTGWRVGFEQKTPGHVVGMVGRKQPLTIRGSVFMDYAETYLLDPHGRPDRVPLWGTGFGLVAAVGFNWEARFLFSWPLESTLSTEAGEPRFNFSLTGQF